MWHDHVNDVWNFHVKKYKSVNFGINVIQLQETSGHHEHLCF